MQFDDRAEAARQVTALPYSHLRYYFARDLEGQSGSFREGTRFADVFARYLGDRAAAAFYGYHLATVELRVKALLGDLIETRYGPQGHLEAANFRDESGHKVFMNEITRGEDRNDTTEDPANAPVPQMGVDAALDLLTFGALAKVAANLRSRDLKDLAGAFGVPSGPVLASYLHCLALLRNTCAHISPIYGRRFRIGVQVLAADEAKAQSGGAALSRNGLFALTLALARLTISHPGGGGTGAGSGVGDGAILGAVADFPTGLTGLVEQHPIWVRGTDLPAQPEKYLPTR